MKTEKYFPAFYKQRVLITGGTGTAGKKCVEVLLKSTKPERIIIFSRDEVKQFEMRKIFPDPPQKKDSIVRYVVGDIRDKNSLTDAFDGVDIVIHTAALKQVDTCEYNPMEAVKTNIIGTQNIIEAAKQTGVKKIMALSTDKAADPVNLYGATKLTAEKLFISGNRHGPMISLVRYGNVLGSRGSVLLQFQEQKLNGCLLLTDSRMTRFWITPEEAVKFIFLRVGDMKGGEVFVPYMPSSKVIDLATAVIGDYYGTCRIEEIGVRPGEKIHEVLVSPNEIDRAYEMNGYYMILPSVKTFTRDWSVEGRKKPRESYTSKTNNWQIGVEELEELIN